MKKKKKTEAFVMTTPHKLCVIAQLYKVQCQYKKLHTFLLKLDTSM